MSLQPYNNSSNLCLEEAIARYIIEKVVDKIKNQLVNEEMKPCGSPLLSWWY
jgi:hypothetical protein